MCLGRGMHSPSALVPSGSVMCEDTRVTTMFFFFSYHKEANVRLGSCFQM